MPDYSGKGCDRMQLPAVIDDNRRLILACRCRIMYYSEGSGSEVLIFQDCYAVN
jgi:hypothetical protein